MTDPRDTGRWRRLRKELREAATYCAIRNGPLIHNARPRSRWTPSVDHIHPVAHGGDPFDRANLQVVHYGCNASKSARVRNGTDTPTAPRTPCPGHGPGCPGRHSRAW